MRDSPAYLRTKKMSREEAMKAKEVEEKKRSAAEKKDKEVLFIEEEKEDKKAQICEDLH